MERSQFMLDNNDRNRLIELARQSIELGLSEMRWVPMPPTELPTALLERRGTFVTLRTNGQLRGCCGNLSDDRRLSDDVWRNAWAAAFADPRFSPLEESEWVDTEIHISVLSPLETLEVTNEDELLAQLRPQIDGLVFEREDGRATFLPEVWDQLPEPREFVRHLKQKGGWPATSWPNDLQVRRYTTEVFGSEPHAAAPRSRRA